MEMTHGFQTEGTQGVLFNLRMFEDLCQHEKEDLVSIAGAGECLIDAVTEICRAAAEPQVASSQHGTFEAELLSDAVMGICGFDSSDQPSKFDFCSIRAELVAAREEFQKQMPDLFERAKAGPGFAALLDLTDLSMEPQDLKSSEQRSLAISNAQRFAKTLAAYVAAQRATSDRPELVH